MSKMFENRHPEAAAHQLAVVLASATEIHMAELERMRLRTGTSKAQLARKEAICESLGVHCAELGITTSGLRGEKCPRLKDWIDAYNAKHGL
jgi:hypothetical protein